MTTEKRETTKRCTTCPHEQHITWCPEFTCSCYSDFITEHNPPSQPVMESPVCGKPLSPLFDMTCNLPKGHKITCYHQGSAPVAQSVPTPLRDPTSEELESPLFNAIWKAIKGWDLRRENAAGYAGATGTDVCTILDAIKPAAQSVPTLLLEALENIEALSHRPEGVDFDNPIEQLRSVHEIAVVTLNVKRTSRRCPECDQSGFHKMSCDTRDKETL